jgi:hypothetical protein
MTCILLPRLTARISCPQSHGLIQMSQLQNQLIPSPRRTPDQVRGRRPGTDVVPVKTENQKKTGFRLSPE